MDRIDLPGFCLLSGVAGVALFTGAACIEPERVWEMAAVSIGIVGGSQLLIASAITGLLAALERNRPRRSMRSPLRWALDTHRERQSRRTLKFLFPDGLPGVGALSEPTSGGELSETPDPRGRVAIAPIPRIPQGFHRL